MISELEKQFFDTFGIEPKETITCIIEEDWLNDYHLKIWYPISEWMKNNAPCKGEKECSNKCNCYQVKNKYPQITDRHYLELICILNKNVSIMDRLYRNEMTIECLKTMVLHDLIRARNVFDVKHQVQQMFNRIEQ